MMKRILITGAAGRIGKVLREGLKENNFILRLCDIADLGEASTNEEIVQANICDLTSMIEATKNVDYIIHLAGIPTEKQWDDLSQMNINGTYHVFEAARMNNVKRMIFASSNHAVGFHALPQEIDTQVSPRPDTLYGVTKVFGEALGHFYADKYDLSVACLRIGSFLVQPKEQRHLRTWISHRDMIQLVYKCVMAPAFNFLIIYGVSANSRNKWHNGETAQFLEYYPQDNAEIYAKQLENVVDINVALTNKYHGGEFCDIAFGRRA